MNAALGGFRATERPKWVEFVPVLGTGNGGAESAQGWILELRWGNSHPISDPLKPMNSHHPISDFDTLEEEVLALRERCERAEAELESFKEDLWSIPEVHQALDALSRKGSEFVIQMDHRLRTSLTGMLGMVELLKHCDLGEAELLYANCALESGNDLMQMFNDILDYCRMDAGHVQLNAARLEREVLYNALTLPFEDHAREAGIRFEKRLGERVPAELIVDVELLSKALGHLLSNTARFAPGSKIELICEVQGIRENAELCLIVGDTGPGIAPEDLERVCEAFETANERSNGGLGLGLTLVRRLAQLMGGTLTLASELGRGTTATLRFPLAEITDAKCFQELLAQPIETVRPRILVVEDNLVNQRVATGFLRMVDCEADTASNGFEAIERLSEQTYDLVLMDCMMPECGGFEATQRIREGKAGEANAGIPIVALTADGSSDARQSCLHAGMDDYMTKPVRFDLLRSMLRIWLPPELRPVIDAAS